MKRHALLSPSSASRWIMCPPSARLEEKKPDTAGEAADEGTLAHKLAEVMLEYDLKQIDKLTFLNRTKQIKKDKLYTESMWEYCEQFKVFVLSQYSDALERSKDAVIFLEQEVDLTHLAPESFGTRDIAIVADHILDITDLKYGKGVLVEAAENKQLMLYALGTLEEFDCLYDIHTVRMTIHQPRIDNYSTWEISAKQLKDWAKTILMPAAKLAWAGKGKLQAGSHCTFCRVRNTCKALANYNMELAVHEFAEPTELSDKELVAIFKKASTFKAWINSIEDYMLKMSLEKDKHWPGLKLVAGKSTRAISDKEKAIALLKSKKFRPSQYLSSPELLGITALEKNIGSKLLTQIIGRLIIKPDGKPALVDSKDPRPAFHSAEAAKKEFNVSSTNKMSKRKTSKR